MTVQLNHTIVWCRDKQRSSTFLAEMLGCDPPQPVMRFMAVMLANGVGLDFGEKTGPIASQHYAFLVSESEFDAILGRIRERGLDHWADPGRTQFGKINHRFGGAASISPIPTDTCSKR